MPPHVVREICSEESQALLDQPWRLAPRRSIAGDLPPETVPSR